MGEIMSGYVYKIVNRINGKWYIGSHDGSNKNYMGSGIALRAAIEKHGIENFEKSILYEENNIDLIRESEELILNMLDAASDPMSYNLKNEACGGSFPGVKNGMYGKKLTPDQRYECGSAFRGKKRPDFAESISGENNPMYGKNYHTHGIVKKSKQNAGKTYEEIFGEQKAKVLKETLSKSQTGTKHKLSTHKCPHCCSIGSGPNMTRYHFDNCLLNEENPNNIIGKFSGKEDMLDKRKMIFVCPHCEKEGMNMGNMNRWHFDNCKRKK